MAPPPCPQTSCAGPAAASLGGVSTARPVLGPCTAQRSDRGRVILEGAWLWPETLPGRSAPGAPGPALEIGFHPCGLGCLRSPGSWRPALGCPGKTLTDLCHLLGRGVGGWGGVRQTSNVHGPASVAILSPLHPARPRVRACAGWSCGQCWGPGPGSWGARGRDLSPAGAGLDEPRGGAWPWAGPGTGAARPGWLRLRHPAPPPHSGLRTSPARRERPLPGTPSRTRSRRRMSFQGKKSIPRITVSPLRPAPSAHRLAGLGLLARGGPSRPGQAPCPQGPAPAPGRPPVRAVTLYAPPPGAEDSKSRAPRPRPCRFPGPPLRPGTRGRAAFRSADAPLSP